MSDWIGLAFFLLLVIAAFIGVKQLSKQKKRTNEEFERNAAENYSGLGASMNALQEILNPESAKSKEVAMQMKDGRYQKKKDDGSPLDGEAPTGN